MARYIRFQLIDSLIESVALQAMTNYELLRRLRCKWHSALRRMHIVAWELVWLAGRNENCTARE